jgi:hypothetical protein
MDMAGIGENPKMRSGPYFLMVWINRCGNNRGGLVPGGPDKTALAALPVKPAALFVVVDDAFPCRHRIVMPSQASRHMAIRLDRISGYFNRTGL